MMGCGPDDLDLKIGECNQKLHQGQDFGQQTENFLCYASAKNATQNMCKMLLGGTTWPPAVCNQIPCPTNIMGLSC